MVKFIPIFCDISSIFLKVHIFTVPTDVVLVTYSCVYVYLDVYKPCYIWIYVSMFNITWNVPDLEQPTYLVKENISDYQI